MNTMDLIQEFQEVTRTERDTYAYSSGYLGSMLAAVLDQLPAKSRAQYVRQLKEHIEMTRSNIAMRELSASLGE